MSAGYSARDKEKAMFYAMKKLNRIINPGEVVIKILDINAPIDENNIMVFRSKGDLSKFTTNANGKYTFEEGPDGFIDVKINKNSPFYKICPVCGKEFVLRDLGNNKTCCSRECSALYKRNDIRKQYLDLPNPENKDYLGKQIPYIKAIAGINIGRQLIGDEVAYALDGNQNNLDPKNIVVLKSRNDLHKLIHTNDNRYSLVKNPDGLTYSVNTSVVSVLKKVCEHCGKEFEINNLSESDHRFCSKSCAKQSTRDTSKNNYASLYKPNEPGAKVNGSIMEHRYVMQQHLGRPLYPTEVVHHNNQLRYDNRIENLTLFDSNNSHTMYHNYDKSEIKQTINENGAVHCDRLQSIVEIHRPGHDRTCRYCGKSFNVIDANNPRVFCSPACRTRWVSIHPEDSNIPY